MAISIERSFIANVFISKTIRKLFTNYSAPYTSYGVSRHVNPRKKIDPSNAIKQSHRSMLCSKLSYNKIIKRSYSSSYTISHKSILCLKNVIFIPKRYYPGPGGKLPKPREIKNGLDAINKTPKLPPTNPAKPLAMVPKKPYPQKEPSAVPTPSPFQKAVALRNETKKIEKLLMCSINPCGFKFINSLPKKRPLTVCVPLVYNKIITRNYSSLSCAQVYSHKNTLCYTFKIFIQKRFTGSKKVIDAAKKTITEMQKVGPSSQIQHTEIPSCMIKPDYSVLSYTPISTQQQQSTSAPTPVQLEGGTDPNYQPKILSEDAQEKRPDLFTPQPPVQTEQVNEVPKAFPYNLPLNTGLGSAAQANIKSTPPSAPIQSDDTEIDLQSTFFDQATSIPDAIQETSAPTSAPTSVPTPTPVTLPASAPELSFSLPEPLVPSELSVPLDSPAQDVAPSIEIENHPVLSISDQIKINEENKKNQHEKQQAKKNLPNNDNDKTVT